jgi:hypothetical protein
MARMGENGYDERIIGAKLRGVSVMDKRGSKK